MQDDGYTTTHTHAQMFTLQNSLDIFMKAFKEIEIYWKLFYHKVVFPTTTAQRQIQFKLKHFITPMYYCQWVVVVVATTTSASVSQ